MLGKPLRLSVKMLVLDKDGRCLLLKRSMSSKGNPGKWDLPGGKIDSGENFDEALLREVSEETGISVSIHRVLGTAESELRKVRVIYLILEGHLESGQVRLSSEHDDYIWVNPQELPKMNLADQFQQFAKSYSLTRCESDKHKR